MSEPYENPPQDKPEDLATRHINVKVKDQNDNEVIFKIKRTTPLEKLMSAYAQQQGKARDSLRFHFDGARIQPNDTPDTLDLDDDEMIDVFQEQLGGHEFL